MKPNLLMDFALVFMILIATFYWLFILMAILTLNCCD